MPRGRRRLCEAPADVLEQEAAKNIAAAAMGDDIVNGGLIEKSGLFEGLPLLPPILQKDIFMVLPLLTQIRASGACHMWRQLLMQILPSASLQIWGTANRFPTGSLDFSSGLQFGLATRTPLILQKPLIEWCIAHGGVGHIKVSCSLLRDAVTWFHGSCAPFNDMLLLARLVEYSVRSGRLRSLVVYSSDQYWSSPVDLLFSAALGRADYRALGASTFSSGDALKLATSAAAVASSPAEPPPHTTPPLAPAQLETLGVVQAFGSIKYELPASLHALILSNQRAGAPLASVDSLDITFPPNLARLKVLNVTGATIKDILSHPTLHSSLRSLAFEIRREFTLDDLIAIPARFENLEELSIKLPEFSNPADVLRLGGSSSDSSGTLHATFRSSRLQKLVHNVPIPVVVDCPKLEDCRLPLATRVQFESPAPLLRRLVLSERPSLSNPASLRRLKVICDRASYIPGILHNLLGQASAGSPALLALCVDLTDLTLDFLPYTSAGPSAVQVEPLALAHPALACLRLKAGDVLRRTYDDPKAWPPVVLDMPRLRELRVYSKEVTKLAFAPPKADGTVVENALEVCEFDACRKLTSIAGLIGRAPRLLSLKLERCEALTSIVPDGIPDGPDAERDAAAPDKKAISCGTAARAAKRTRRELAAAAAPSRPMSRSTRSTTKACRAARLPAATTSACAACGQPKAVKTAAAGRFVFQNLHYLIISDCPVCCELE